MKSPVTLKVRSVKRTSLVKQPGTWKAEALTMLPPSFRRNRDMATNHELTDEKLNQIQRGVEAMTSQERVDLWVAINGLKNTTAGLDKTLGIFQAEVNARVRPCDDFKLLKQDVDVLKKEDDSKKGVKSTILIQILSMVASGVIAAMGTALIFWIKSGMPGMPS